MITWITLNLFEYLFSITLANEALQTIQFLGFVELLMEMAIVFIAIVLSLINLGDKKSG